MVDWTFRAQKAIYPCRLTYVLVVQAVLTVQMRSDQISGVDSRIVRCRMRGRSRAPVLDREIDLPA